MLFRSCVRVLTTSATASLLLACSAPARPGLPSSGWTSEKKAERWKLEGFEANLDLSGIASVGRVL